MCASLLTSQSFICPRVHLCQFEYSCFRNRKATLSIPHLTIQLGHNNWTVFHLLTCLFVKHDLILKLLALLQGVADAEDDAFTRLWPIQKLTGAALLHDLCPGEACKLTEAIGAVDNWKTLWHLSIGQDEVAIWGGKMRKGLGLPVHWL